MEIKSQRKDTILNKFKNGQANILVATPVVEVELIFQMQR